MGWSIAHDSRWDRFIGYGVPAYCDHPDCRKVIDRGLSYVCANEQPYGHGCGDERDGCGLYFCFEHFVGTKHGDKCERCAKGKKPFPAKPDHPTWLRHQLRDQSWAEWRDLNPKKVAIMRTLIPASRPRRRKHGVGE